MRYPTEPIACAGRQIVSGGGRVYIATQAQTPARRARHASTTVVAPKTPVIVCVEIQIVSGMSQGSIAGPPTTGALNLRRRL